jgi:hypothetical protein
MARLSRLAYLLGFFLLLLGSAYASDDHGSGPKGHIKFQQILPDGIRGVVGHHFRLTPALRDLDILLFWRQISGSHVATVEIYLPNGHLYYRRHVPFVIGDLEQSPLRCDDLKLEDSDDDDDEDKDKKKDDNDECRPQHWRLLRVPFPVDGTLITQRTLTGTWKARVYLDDLVKPIARAPFHLSK